MLNTFLIHLQGLKDIAIDTFTAAFSQLCWAAKTCAICSCAVLIPCHMTEFCQRICESVGVSIKNMFKLVCFNRCPDKYAGLILHNFWCNSISSIILGKSADRFSVCRLAYPSFCLQLHHTFRFHSLGALFWHSNFHHLAKKCPQLLMKSFLLIQDICCSQYVLL